MILGEARHVLNSGLLLDAAAAGKPRPDELRKIRRPFRGGSGESLRVIELVECYGRVTAKAVWRDNDLARTDWVTAHSLEGLRAVLDQVLSEFFA